MPVGRQVDPYTNQVIVRNPTHRSFRKEGVLGKVPKDMDKGGKDKGGKGKGK